MTKDEFIRRIRIAVYDASVKGVLSTLEAPPGRRPASAIIELSRWFKQLSEVEQANLAAVVRLAVKDAVYGMLAVIDGVRSVREVDEAPGTLQLRFLNNEHTVVLNDQHGEMLHELFAEDVPSS